MTRKAMPTPDSMSGCWFENDTLHLDEANLDAARRDFLAPTTALSLEGCAPSWVAGHVLAPAWQPSAPNISGSIVHDTLEQLFQQSPEARTEDTYQQIVEDTLAKIVQQHPLSPAQRDSLVELLYKNWRGLNEIVSPREISVWATEHKIQGEIGGVPFRGYADLVVENEQGLQLVDYKTGKTPTSYKIRKYGDHHGKQITAYTMVLAQQTGGSLQDSQLWYTAEANRRVVKSRRGLQSQIRALFRSSWGALSQAVESNQWATKPGALCGWCPLVAVCPAARNGGYKPRAGGLPEAHDPRLPQPDAPSVAARNPAESDSPHGRSMETKTLQETRPPEETSSLPAIPVLFGENKTWEKMAGDKLNGNHYSVQGTFGTITLATSLIGGANLKVTKPRVETMARCLERCVATAQNRISDSHSPGDGIATRLRGALRTYIEQCPPPIGDSHTVEELRAWGGKAVNYMVFQATVAHSMLLNPDKDLDLSVLF